MSSVTWKDVVDLDAVYLRNACKSPASNTAYLTLRCSHCRSTCRPAHMTPNFLFFVWRKLAVILSLTCLATDASLTADPVVESLIPARSHTFVEIDHEIISMVILLPSTESFNKGCCQLQAKVCARSTG